MDIFSFLDRDTYTKGHIINDIKSVTWVERFRDAGEFTIVGDPTNILLDDLALGTFISHIDTLEVMVVENQEIDETKDGPPIVTITGRSAEAIALENRIVVDSLLNDFNPALQYFGFSVDSKWEYTLAFGSPSLQLYSFLRSVILNSIMGSAENYPNIDIIREFDDSSYIGAIPESFERGLDKLANVYTVTLDMLAYMKAGIKVTRPHDVRLTLDFRLHRGEDKRNSVIFDWSDGDLDSARYLFSNKDYKNSAYVASEHYGLRIRPIGPTGWDLRVTNVDVSNYTYFHEDYGLNWWLMNNTQKKKIQDSLNARGGDALEKQKPANLLDTTISDTSKYVYNKDYHIGDLVTVNGNFGSSSPMRVIEHARTFSDEGVTGIPTLELFTEVEDEDGRNYPSQNDL